MKTLFRTLTVLAALASGALSADIVTTHAVHELDLRDVTLPATANGVLSFRKCDDCDIVSLRASAGTQYLLNGEAVELSDLRNAVMRAANRSDDPGALVKHALANDALIYVKVDL